MVHELSDAAEFQPVDGGVTAAMKAAADSAQEVALAEADQKDRSEAKEVASGPSAEGIPQEVIDAMSKENIAVAIRKALESLARPKVTSKEAKAEEQEKEKLAARITRATGSALSDPLVRQASASSTEKIISKETKEIEGKTQLKSKVAQQLGGAVHQAEQNARQSAVGVLNKANQQTALLRKYESGLQSSESKAAAQNRILEAQTRATEAQGFLQVGREKAEKEKVEKETARVMAEEEAKLAAKLKAKAEAEMQARLAREMALAAKKKLELQLMDAYQAAKRKVEEEEARAQREHDARTQEANDQEANAFSSNIAIGEVQGYWTNRRRFSVQKQFVKHGYFGEEGKSKEQRLAERKKAQAKVAAQNKEEQKRLQKLMQAKIEAEMKKMLPPGTVDAMVRKMAQKMALNEADQITAKTALETEEKAVASAVKDIATKEETQPAN
jgi:translation initiation factor IF-2